MLTYTKVLKTWFDSIDSDTRLKLFGQSQEKLYTVTEKYERSLGEKSPAREEICRFDLEIPLSGQSYADIAFVYFFKDAIDKNAPNTILGGSLPLVQKIAPLYRPDQVIFIEFDTGSGNQTSCPSMFFKIYSDYAAGKILTVLQEENPNSRQWANFTKTWEQNKSRCFLRHLGLMLGRDNLPVRVVSRINDRKLEGNVAEDLVAFFNTFDFPFFSSDVLEKLRTLSHINFDNPCPTWYLVSLDLLPDGTWGKTLGLEIFQTIIDKYKINTTLTHRKKVVQLLKDWQLTDDRINFINDCEKILFLTDEKTKEQFLFSYQLSHFKLRWHDGKPLPAKAYFQIDQI